MLARVESIPGVAAAGATNELPFGDRRSTVTFEIEGRPEANATTPAADFRLASPGYFQAMGIPLLLGRTLTVQDNGATARVALINDFMARTFWPQQNPIGNYLIAGRPSARYQIVGVVGNVKHGGLTADAGPEIYVPWLDRPVPDMYFVISGTGDLSSLVPAIRAAVHEIDKDQPVYGVRTMKQAVERTISEERSNTTLLSILAGLALSLAAIGVYGVIAYLVEQRRHEIGVRMALGARRGDVLGMLLKQGAAMAAVGLAAGCLGALVTTQLLKKMLFGVAPNDWRTFAGVAVLLAAVVLLATLIPARRATKVDPIIALRAE